LEHRLRANGSTYGVAPLEHTNLETPAGKKTGSDKAIMA
jgi:hypothetical protein